MRSFITSLSLFLVAGIVCAVLILSTVYLDGDGGAKFAPDPALAEMADHTPARVAPGRSQQAADRVSDGRREDAPGVDGPRPSAHEQELTAAIGQVKGELAAEKARAEALTNELASTRRTDEAELATAHLLLGGERARSADLLRDLARAREWIARTFHDRVIELAKLGAQDQALTGERIRHAAAPGAGDGALPIAVRLGIGLPPVHRPDEAGGPDEPDQGRRQSSEDASGRDTGAIAALSPVPTERASAWASLPLGTGAHVTVAYARGSEPARQRALTLTHALEAGGIDVDGLIDAPSPARAGRVTYYYGTDRANAERIAALCAAPSPSRGRLPALGRLPRPGTIGVAVAD